MLGLHFHLEDGGSKFLRRTSNYLPDHTASHSINVVMDLSKILQFQLQIVTLLTEHDMQIRAGWRSGTALDSYYGSIRFESWPGNQIS
jgi:hypothetical protein